MSSNSNNRYSKSGKLFSEALKYIPAGTSSTFRLWGGVCPPGYEECAIYAKKAKGAYLWDADGNKYIDYRLGFGPVILGHSFPSVVNAASDAAKDGAIYALNNEREVQVAKKVRKMVRCAEMMRFVNSGTEATMTALRIARAYTKKDKIIKFEGHYHGHHDYLLFSLARSLRKKDHHMPKPESLGIPNSVKDLVYVTPWNDFNEIEKIVKAHHKEVAAIICEPVTGNSSVIPPEKGFLNHLRKLCDQYSIALIFDEVKTGFRLAPGGAQEVYRVTPDVACFAKALGNGYPVAAVAGKKEYMGLVGPNGVFHGGTYSSNPISMAAANATLDELNKEKVWSHMGKTGSQLIKGIKESFEEHNIKAVVQGFPTMFKFMFTGRNKIVDCRESMNACNLDLSMVLQRELLKRGVMIDEEPEEPIYMSYSHGEKEVEAFIEALDKSLIAIKGHPIFKRSLV